MCTISRRRRASASASFIDRPLCLRRGSETFSTHVIESKSVECWKTIAHFFRTGYIASSSFFEISSPSSQISPWSGESRPTRCLISTLLPTPEAPMMKSTSPSCTSKLTSDEDGLRAERLADVPGTRSPRASVADVPASHGAHVTSASAARGASHVEHARVDGLLDPEELRQLLERRVLIVELLDDAVESRRWRPSGSAGAAICSWVSWTSSPIIASWCPMASSDSRDRSHRSARSPGDPDAPLGERARVRPLREARGLEGRGSRPRGRAG